MKRIEDIDGYTFDNFIAIEKNRSGICQHLKLKHSQFFHIENNGII